jgi:hypothetical protein
MSSIVSGSHDGDEVVKDEIENTEFSDLVAKVDALTVAVAGLKDQNATLLQLMAMLVGKASTKGGDDGVSVRSSHSHSDSHPDACQKIKGNGERCTAKAKKAGFCSLHNPERVCNGKKKNGDACTSPITKKYGEKHFCTSHKDQAKVEKVVVDDL